MGTYEVTTEDGTYQVDVDDGPSTVGGPYKADKPTSFLEEGGTSKYDIAQGALKGIAKGASSIVTAPADLLFRGANALANKITGNEISPEGGYPSDYVNKLVDYASGGEGNKAAELGTDILGNVATAFAVPSQAANVATKATQLGKSIPIISELFTAAPKATNLLLKTGANAVEGGALNVLLNPKSEDLIDTAEKGALLQAGIPLVASAAGKLVKGLSNTTENVANALDRKSLGTRATDYMKGSNARTIETPSGEVTSFVKSKLDDLVSSGELGLSRDPSKMLTRLEQGAEETAAPLREKIASYDEGVKLGLQKPATADFSNTVDYINSGKVPADEVDAYLEQVANLQKNIEEKGGGSLDYIQKQKQAFSNKWKSAQITKDPKSGFYRALYGDLKNTVEAHIPEAKSINQELQKYIIAEPIARRALAAEEAASPLSKLRDIGYTTGGIGVPTALGAGFGGPVGAALGAATGLATKALASPTGQALTASVLRKSANAGNTIGDLITALGAAGKAAIPLTLLEQDKEPQTNPAASLLYKDLFTTPDNNFNKNVPVGESSKSGDNQDMKGTRKEIENAIDQDPYTAAVYEAESGRNPNAKNPNSSAKGGFQFVDRTARALGLKNPFDLGESLDAFKKLTDENRRVAGDDPMLLYSAHYLGAPLLKKVLENKPLNNTEQSHVAYLTDKALPRFKNIYEKVIASKNDIGEA